MNFQVTFLGFFFCILVSAWLSLILKQFHCTRCISSFNTSRSPDGWCPRWDLFSDRTADGM